MKKVIATDKAPAAIGPYSQAIEVNGMVYTSGIIPVGILKYEKSAGGSRYRHQPGSKDNRIH